MKGKERDKKEEDEFIQTLRTASDLCQGYSYIEKML